MVTNKAAGLVPGLSLTLRRTQAWQVDLASEPAQVCWGIWLDSKRSQGLGCAVRGAFLVLTVLRGPTSGNNLVLGARDDACAFECLRHVFVTSVPAHQAVLSCSQALGTAVVRPSLHEACLAWSACKHAGHFGPARLSWMMPVQSCWALRPVTFIGLEAGCW